ncbi:MAG: hypothetical protein K0R48_1124 [Gammaproteobacteria bacterium]|jgi:hypothetical protein|nr:hypothetical protein [Gammaproteobacteria bacterium]
MSAFNPFYEKIKLSLEIAVQACDDIKDLNLQRKEVETLTPLLIEAVKADIDISYYLSYYIRWVAKAIIEPKYLYIAKIYIGYATTLLQHTKDAEIEKSHTQVFSDLSLKIDAEIKSNIKKWIVEALQAINEEKFDTVETLLKQVVDNLKFVSDPSEREINAAVLSHCYSILIPHKVMTAEDFIVDKNFDAAEKEREEAVNFLKYVKDKEIETFHLGKLADLQTKIVTLKPQNTKYELEPKMVFENRGISENSETSSSSLSFSNLSQFFIHTFSLKDSSEDLQGIINSIPSPQNQ